MKTIYYPALAVEFCVAEFQQIEAQSLELYEDMPPEELHREAYALAWRTAMAQCEVERRKGQMARIIRQIKERAL